MLGRRHVLFTFFFLASRAIAQAQPASFQTVFNLDKDYRPVTRLDRLNPMPDAVRAVPAMYAMQSGAGCEGKEAAGPRCLFPHELGLGPQCSTQHLSLVTRWFKTGLPQIGPYSQDELTSALRKRDLEPVCYKPDTAAAQSTWERIRVRVDGPLITVDATRTSRSVAAGVITRYRQTATYQNEDDRNINIVDPPADASDALASGDILDSLDGYYSTSSGRCSIRDADGTTTDCGDPLDSCLIIKRIDATHAELHVESTQQNGHECGLVGVAELKGKDLVYVQAKQHNEDDGRGIRIKTTGPQLTIENLPEERPQMTNPFCAINADLGGLAFTKTEKLPAGSGRCGD